MTAAKLHRRCLHSTTEQQELAMLGYDSLLTHRIEVVLIPAPQPKHRGHKIRVAVSHNPPWYSRLAQARGMSKRMHQGGTLRKRTLKALQRMIDGWFDPRGLEAEILQELKTDLEL